MPAPKKSPRAPSVPLDEAIEKASKVYEKERRHSAPTDVVAQNIGYKSANNGAALATLASLRYYGLLERPRDGQLAVSKDVESYLYAPDESVKRALLLKWMKAPPVFAEIAEKYADGLPSDATLRYDLINLGFSPNSAESVIANFKRSAAFSGLYSTDADSSNIVDPVGYDRRNEPEVRSFEREPTTSSDRPPRIDPTIAAEDSDKIPIRLTGGRRAWLVIPSPFYEKDKALLHAHIDLLISEDQEE
jgi:hypothetical protein